MKKVQLFLVNGIILTFTSFLLKTIGVSFNVYISNKIGTEAVGVYQLVMSIYLFITTLALSGINFACMRLVSEEMAYGKFGNIRKVVSSCLFYSALLGLISGGILFFSSPFISKLWLHNKISILPLQIIAISLPFVSMSACLTGYFSAIRRVGRNAFIQIIDQIISVILISYLLNHLLPNTIDFACISLVFGNTISEILSFIGIYFLYLWDKRKYEKKAILKNSFSKEISRIATPIAITSCIRSGLSTLKQILIPNRLEKSGVSCSTALSQYGMIHGMVMPIILFPNTFIQSFSTLLVPEFSYYYAKDDLFKICDAMKRIFQYTFLFSIFIIGIFFCFSDSISELIYHNIEISKYIKILSPLILFMYFDNIVDGILKGIDKQVGVMAINIIDLLLSVTGIYFFLPIYGIYGYLSVIFFSEILNCFLSIYQLLRIIPFSICYMNWLIKPIFICISLCFLFQRLTITNIYSLIFGIALFLILYLIFLFCFGCIKKEDMHF